MVFNPTFNKISVISWLPVLLVEQTSVHGDLTQDTSAKAVFELATLVVIGTDSTGIIKYKDNYLAFQSFDFERT